jgi:uncharacterized protein (TIGR03118 family)
MLKRVGLIGAGVLVTAIAVASPLSASAHASSVPVKRHGVTQTNLVSDQPGKAALTDPHLINPWGASESPTSPLWVSNAGTNTSTLYSGSVGTTPASIVPLVVDVPGAPTGQVSNDTTDFDLPGTTTPARFIFASIGGFITAWAGGTEATIVAHPAGAMYTGLALAHSPSGPRLLAANFAAGKIDVFDSTFTQLPADGLFHDSHLPNGYSPFNVRELGGKVYVTYAQVDPTTQREVKKPGHGFVDVYTDSGAFIKRLISHGVLDAPWGVAIAPANFGRFSGDLLVGNFGNGSINAFNGETGRFVGPLTDSSGKPIVIDGLWSLLVGNTTVGGTDSVLFTAGPDNETHGLVGKLTAN